MDTPQLPSDPALCAKLEPVVRAPSALPLDQYERALGEYLSAFCHRDPASGWVRDKHVRNTGPYMGTFKEGQWSGTYFGTHFPVLVWYSPDMLAWLRKNRPDGRETVPNPDPLPDGAMMVKEMYAPPASACAGADPTRLRPTSGAAIMVRDAKASHDGWFWGWFGWKDWKPDWPAAADNPYPNMGFGQYCTNCHASASDHQTFATLRNINGEPGRPLVYLSQDFFLAAEAENQHTQVAASTASPDPIQAPRTTYDPEFIQHLKFPAPLPDRDAITPMPSETYDSVWMPGGRSGPTAASQFVTSDQCIGCHDAGSTGLQFDMTQLADGGKLDNHSPYATWRTSPMGLAGRDPVFFAQLASEIGTFHPHFSAKLQDTCLGCHGIMGQRQHAIDAHRATQQCPPFARREVAAAPYPPDPAVSALALKYAALARDGISCTACHRMALAKPEVARFRDGAQNACVDERQAFLNPGLQGFAATFTGSFYLAPAETLYGPFTEPKKAPMKNALGIEPQANADIRSSELCGSCHTVHLPVLQAGNVIGHTYEQATYAEWAFSAYRTGKTPDGDLPAGAGSDAQSCQDCHMPSKDAHGHPVRSKIASIQEYSNFPQTENNLEPKEIDLAEREGFAQHTLVGLNLFLIKMAQQLPDVLGIRTRDPMLAKKGVEPLALTETRINEQAEQRTADIAVGPVTSTGDALEARVTVTNKTGHKFPSGVGFRRAFIEFAVYDANRRLLWSSGRTNGAGMIVDGRDQPIAGEVWWKPDCSARIDPDARAHQPHYEVISREDEAQIYQELTAAPGPGPAPRCGATASPRGELPTSFLSLCAKVKDNRLLPKGFLNFSERSAIAGALGAQPDLAEEAGPTAVGDDPDYQAGGGDTLVYRVPLKDLDGEPASVEATLYYQATPPFYLQDRFCTSHSEDSKRLYYVAGNLDLRGTRADGWKLKLVTSGPIAVR